MSTAITIPPAADLRLQLRDRIAEVRALRRLLRLAEAAEAVQQVRQKRAQCGSLDPHQTGGQRAR